MPKTSYKDKPPGNGGLAPLLKELWNAAVELRGNIEPSDYKRYVLPLIFLRFLSLRYERRRSEIDALADRNSRRPRPYCHRQDSADECPGPLWRRYPFRDSIRHGRPQIYRHNGSDTHRARRRDGQRLANPRRCNHGFLHRLRHGKGRDSCAGLRHQSANQLDHPARQDHGQLHFSQSVRPQSRASQLGVQRLRPTNSQQGRLFAP